MDIRNFFNRQPIEKSVIKKPLPTRPRKEFKQISIKSYLIKV